MFVYARIQGEKNLMKKSFSALMIFLFIQAVFSKEVKICSEPVEFLETFIPGSGISIRLGANYNSFYDDFAQWHGEGHRHFSRFLVNRRRPERNYFPYHKRRSHERKAKQNWRAAALDISGGNNKRV